MKIFGTHKLIFYIKNAVHIHTQKAGYSSLLFVISHEKRINLLSPFLFLYHDMGPM
jgi:hypothetical protein